MRNLESSCEKIVAYMSIKAAPTPCILRVWLDNRAYHIDSIERERFQEIAESELLSLHEGNSARYQVKPSEFATWKEAWNR